jgi:hypothetical protein
MFFMFLLYYLCPLGTYRNFHHGPIIIKKYKNIENHQEIVGVDIISFHFD